MYSRTRRSPGSFQQEVAVALSTAGKRKGVMARPGMTDLHDEPVARLGGPLRWAVDLGYEASVAIAGPLPPPA